MTTTYTIIKLPNKVNNSVVHDVIVNDNTVLLQNVFYQTALDRVESIVKDDDTVIESYSSHSAVVSGKEFLDECQKTRDFLDKGVK